MRSGWAACRCLDHHGRRQTGLPSTTAQPWARYPIPPIQTRSDPHDSVGGTHGFVDWAASQPLKYSIGFNMAGDLCAVTFAPPEHVCSGRRSDQQPRPDVWVTKLTGPVAEGDADHHPTRTPPRRCPTALQTLTAAFTSGSREGRRNVREGRRLSDPLRRFIKNAFNLACRLRPP